MWGWLRSLLASLDRPVSSRWCADYRRQECGRGWEHGPVIRWDVMKTQPWKTGQKADGSCE